MGITAPEEQDISRYIAVLLEPGGIHGQGDAFLKRSKETVRRNKMDWKGMLPDILSHLEERIVNIVTNADSGVVSYADRGKFRAVFKKSFQGDNGKGIKFIINLHVNPEIEKQRILHMLREFRRLLDLESDGKSVELLITEIVRFVNRRRHKTH